MNELDKLPGESKVYKSVDTCSEEILNKVTIAERELILKVGAKVMLLFNVSTKLTNGLRGTVVKLEEDGPTVNFSTVVGITCKHGKSSWFAYKSGTSNCVVGQREQFPLKLACGITAHKSQGQTLPAAYIHSGKEFVAGQLYVAASRVSSQKGVSVLGFDSTHVVRADNRVIDFYQTICCTQPSSDHCCWNKDINFESISDAMQYIEDPDEGCLTQDDWAVIESICESYYDQQGDNDTNENMANLEEVLKLSLSGDKEIYPPETLCVHSILEKLKDPSPQASVEGSLGTKINLLITSLQQPEYSNKMKSFIDIQWVGITLAAKENMKTKKDGTASYNFKGILTAEFDILNSTNLESEFSAVLGHNEFCVEHHALITELVKAIREAIISKLYFEKCLDEHEQDHTNVWDMSNEGKGKVCYIGGWAVVKLIYGHKRCVRKEMTRRYMYINILESLVAQSSCIHSSTKYEETLSVTLMKQYRQNSLVHISNEAFVFFMNLEQLRIKFFATINFTY